MSLESPAQVKRIIKDNRHGIFDDMVFYVHKAGTSYRGKGWDRIKVERNIVGTVFLHIVPHRPYCVYSLFANIYCTSHPPKSSTILLQHRWTNGGRIVQSPIDRALTHLLVPPDKIEKGRNYDSSSLLNLKEFYGSESLIEFNLEDPNFDEELYFTEVIAKVKIWDIPALTKYFSGHVNEQNEIIRNVYKPVLRYDWISRCIRSLAVLGEEEDDWSQQIVRARMLPHVPRPSWLPDYRTIQHIETSGERVSDQHREFARMMSSGSTHRPAYGQQTSSSYQPRPPMHPRYSYESAPFCLVRDNPPEATRVGVPDIIPARPNRWENLARSLKLQKPSLPTDSTQSYVSLITQPNIQRAQNPVETKLEFSVPMTPESSRELLEPQRDQASDIRKRPRATASLEVLPSDPRSALKRTKSGPSPLTPISSTSSTLTVQDNRQPSFDDTQHQHFTPSDSRRCYSPPLTPDERESPPQPAPVSRTISPNRKTSPSLSASPAASKKTDMNRLFVSLGRPMTFWVSGGNFTTEFCIKASGGILHPLVYAQIIILPITLPILGQKTQLSAKEETILDGVESRGFQTVLSSNWIEACLKAQKLVPEEDYVVTRSSPNLVIVEGLEETRETKVLVDDDDSDVESIIVVEDPKLMVKAEGHEIELQDRKRNVRFCESHSEGIKRAKRRRSVKG